MLHQLTTIDHPLLAPYQNINRKKWNRYPDLFIGEGKFVVERMLESDYEVVSVVLGDQAVEYFRDRIPDSVDVIQMPRSLVSRLVGFEFHSGVIACARRRRLRSLQEHAHIINKDPSTLVVCPFTVLPDNLGSIIRMSSGFGAEAVVVGHRSADPFSRRAVRVSMGNVFQLPVFEPYSISAALQTLRDEFGYCIVAATGGPEARTLPMPRPARRLAIVLGNEADGIAPEWLAKCDLQVSIPMAGSTDSLNVANAAAVLLYQFLRVDSCFSAK